MLKWDKNHHSINNGRLIDLLLGTDMKLEVITKETQQYFKDIKQPVRKNLQKQSKSLAEKIWSVISTEFIVENDIDIGFLVEDDNIFPYWLKDLNREYGRWKNLASAVSVTQFGAIGDGQTDSTAAFKGAFGTGGKWVFVPEGVYIVKGLQLPSWTRLVGAGKNKTVIRLHDKAPKRRTLVTNKNPIHGNRNISVEELTLDWNSERLASDKKTASGNNFSSCLTYANVQFGWVKNVEAINAGLHCFDISSSFYSYAGDGTKAKRGSSYIWLDRVTGSGFGDDGVTTHHSDYIFISNSHFHDPSGRSHKAGFSNSNGFEIDDGSRNVWLANNSTTRCFGGVEIKAHATASAASGVHISGHLSVNDNRAFNFRHIGHHHLEDRESQSAYSISAQRLVAIHPVRTKLYQRSSPRALVISGYRNVVINRFLYVGDPTYDYENQTAASIQFRAQNIAVVNGRFQGFASAACDVSIAANSKNVQNVLVQNIHSVYSATKVIDLHRTDSTIRIDNILRIDT